MFRLAARQLVGRSGSRNIASSAPALVKIRSSKPPAPRPASPAERPPVPPAEPTSTAPPPTAAAEPEIFQPSATPGVGGTPTARPTSESAAEPLESANTPLEPPSPSSSATPSSENPDLALPPNSEVDTIPDVPDLSKLPSLDIDPDVNPAIAEPEAEGDGKDGKRTGAKEREYVSSMERTRRAYIRFLLATMAVGGVAGVVYMGQGDGEGQEGVGFWDRVKGNTSDMMDIFNKPAFKTLLPDPLPPTHQRPYTLLVDLDGMLVSSTWDRAHGWRTVKRPGVDYFLSYLSQFYEIVLFTTQPTYTAIPVAEKLDPVGAFMPYKLFRDATRFHDGKVVKDLSYLNRDLQKVIMLDINPEHGALQPDNTVQMKGWNGEKGDRGLVDMIPFLESIAMFNVKDVRPILKAYQGKDIPVEYAKKEAEAKRVATEEWERRNPAGAGGGSAWLGGMFGGVAPNTSKANQPMTFLDQKRAEAQKAYALEQKYYKEHEEEYKRMIEEDKARQMAEMKGSLMGFFGGGGSQPKQA